MGRHRRSAPHAPAAPGAGLSDAPTGTRTGAPAATARPRSHRAARGHGAAPLRTGLLGASAAVAMGAVAVASGLIPGDGRFDGGTGDDHERVRTGALPGTTAPLGGRSATPADGAPEEPGRDTRRRTAPDSARPSAPMTPSTSPSPGRTAKSPAAQPGSQRTAEPTGRPSSAAPAPTASPPEITEPPEPPEPPDAPPSAAERVLALVNQERARAGCSPVTADRKLGALAQRFSDDMARRGFFGHTDPDGDTPWDRARDLGIDNLGGENLARGQADAEAVMETWLDSPGHRANILNCEYRTLGVGARFGPGGPWWTQEFGF
ncbi:membrane protein CrgA [Streptomyces sp. NBRC 110611]|uniref:CAP domain-containing protein n=1 Tax=Streptomyces sp. NBRC 110611 TaxID=1621259 RepID=UPI000856D82D|nr:CAP domain-containing protein [Streptomyces sp. NBRC 110611]GAU70127.1 membrane protein CrgA [Streptomyces sp. NBRC 110611]